MDIKTIDHLCNLSKLNYTDEGKEKVMGEMSAIIELMDTVKEFDVVYDDTKDNNSISYDEVRKDVAKPSFPHREAAQQHTAQRKLLCSSEDGRLINEPKG